MWHSYLFGTILMQSTPVLQCLRKRGQLLDSEIAAATGLPLTKVRASLLDLAATGEISQCTVIKFDGGKEIRGILARISGYTPPRAAGREPGAKN